ncbi:MAG TPA: outer membrane lipoprotein-sorting protein [Myxococcales bacterium]|nr:outer membrane lipoprotein-sorting protein [Myxococcales bacterium]
MRTLGTMAAVVSVAAAAVVAGGARAAEAMDKAAMVKLLWTLDDRQKNPGDFKMLAYLEQKERDKTDVVREALIYRRGADRKLIILFTKPKAEAGKGYLRIDNNLWSYDPNTGKWERRTERERIAGTDSRRADFDESRMAEEFDPTYEGEEKLGQFTVRKLTLNVKPGVDVAFPVVKLWVDVATDNVLKRQELALSGRLMRTVYYPKWNKLYSESKKADVWFPQEIRIYDEVEKANSTLILIKEVDPRPVEANLFTKAWLESKSR